MGHFIQPGPIRTESDGRSVYGWLEDDGQLREVVYDPDGTPHWLDRSGVPPGSAPSPNLSAAILGSIVGMLAAGPAGAAVGAVVGLATMATKPE